MRPPFFVAGSKPPDTTEAKGSCSERTRDVQDIPEKLLRLVEPVVRAHGLELVDAALGRGPTRSLLRVIVDTPAGDGRVKLDECAAVSRELGHGLDVEELIAGRVHARSHFARRRPHARARDRLRTRRRPQGRARDARAARRPPPLQGRARRVRRQRGAPCAATPRTSRSNSRPSNAPRPSIRSTPRRSRRGDPWTWI